MFRTLILASASSIILSCAALAQDNGPVIVSERIQEIAAELPIAERLGIKWEFSSPEGIGRYMGILAAASEVANTIAAANKRDVPSDEDYLAALAAFCFWPNKPPLAEPYWSEAYAAFGNQNIRDKLQSAVGPLAVALPAAIAADEGQAAVVNGWPTIASEYFSDVLNLESLRDAQ